MARGMTQLPCSHRSGLFPVHAVDKKRRLHGFAYPLCDPLYRHSPHYDSGHGCHQRSCAGDCRRVAVRHFCRHCGRPAEPALQYPAVCLSWGRLVTGRCLPMARAWQALPGSCSSAALSAICTPCGRSSSQSCPSAAGPSRSLPCTATSLTTLYGSAPRSLKLQTGSCLRMPKSAKMPCMSSAPPRNISRM